MNNKTTKKGKNIIMKTIVILIGIISTIISLFLAQKSFDNYSKFIHNLLSLIVLYSILYFTKYVITVINKNNKEWIKDEGEKFTYTCIVTIPFIAYFLYWAIVIYKECVADGGGVFLFIISYLMYQGIGTFLFFMKSAFDYERIDSNYFYATASKEQIRKYEERKRLSAERYDREHPTYTVHQKWDGDYEITKK